MSTRSICSRPRPMLRPAMAIFPVRTFGDPVLRTVAEEVDEIDESIERLVEDMFDTMYAAPGVGLAAPQIGVSKRLFVADVGEDEPFVMINPVLVETSGEWEFEEGCLSVPGHFWEIMRPSFARARGLALDGSEVEYAGDELMGRVLQHEIDHLDGNLLLGHLAKRSRKQALRVLREESLGVPGTG